MNTVVRTVCATKGCSKRPRNQWAYTKADLPALAAAYVFGITKNHPFFDGNKGTAGVVCETFLFANGRSIESSNDEWYQAVLALSAGELDERQFAQWLRKHLSGDS